MSRAHISNVNITADHVHLLWEVNIVIVIRNLMNCAALPPLRGGAVS